MKMILLQDESSDQLDLKALGPSGTNKTFPPAGFYTDRLWEASVTCRNCLHQHPKLHLLPIT